MQRRMSREAIIGALQSPRTPPQLKAGLFRHAVEEGVISPQGQMVPQPRPVGRPMMRPMRPRPLTRPMVQPRRGILSGTAHDIFSGLDSSSLMNKTAKRVVYNR